MENNIHKTALIFEGGGMRGAFSAGIVKVLLDEKLYFNYVSGISAGSSNVINYMLRDSERARKSFVDIVEDPNFGGWKSFFKGKGYFNSEYLYEQACINENILPLDYEKFISNPAHFKIGAFDAEVGKEIYWGKEDVDSLFDLVKIVRASSSMPIFMPQTKVKGRTYVDGGLGGGIPLERAIKDGYSKFFIVRTRKKDYRKHKPKHEQFIKTMFKKQPKIADALLNRYIKYNYTLGKIDDLEKKGDAFVVYPNFMNVENKDTDLEKLKLLYSAAVYQGERDKDKWKQFINGIEGKTNYK